MKKVKFRRRLFGTIVLNEEVFNEIKNYIEMYYDAHHTDIERHDGKIDGYNNLCDVNNQISQHSDSILKISITAHKGDNVFTMCLNNKPQIGEGTLTINAEINESMKEELKKLLATINNPTNSINSRAKENYHFLLSFGRGMSVIAFFLIIPDDIKFLALGVFTALVFAVLFLWVVMSIKVIPVLKARKQDEVLIRFWTKAQLMQAQEKADDDAKQMNFRKRVIGAVLLVISLVIIAVT